MIGRLERLAQLGDEGTLGLLEFGALRHFCLEPPWRGNRVGSRIPSGDYRLERHLEGRWAGTWALVGGTVSHQPTPGFDRAAVVFHPGNLATDSSACPLPGLRVGILGGRLAVLDSRAALAEILDLLDPRGDHRLEIRDRLGGWDPGG
jgi:hypothetical protein